MRNTVKKSPKYVLMAFVVGILFSSCWKTWNVPKPEPLQEPVTVEQAQEFVPRTFSGNTIVMPESTGGMTVTAELKATDDRALTGCSAIMAQADRYGCEDEIRMARANENANPSDCEFIHDLDAKEKCVMGATIRKAQNEHDPKVCATLTASWAVESCRVAAIMGNPMKNPTIEECQTITLPAIKTACMARAATPSNFPSLDQ